MGAKHVWHAACRLPVPLLLGESTLDSKFPVSTDELVQLVVASFATSPEWMAPASELEGAAAEPAIEMQGAAAEPAMRYPAGFAMLPPASELGAAAEAAMQSATGLAAPLDAMSQLQSPTGVATSAGHSAVRATSLLAAAAAVATSQS